MIRRRRNRIEALCLLAVLIPQAAMALSSGVKAALFVKGPTYQGLIVQDLGLNNNVASAKQAQFRNEYTLLAPINAGDTLRIGALNAYILTGTAGTAELNNSTATFYSFSLEYPLGSGCYQVVSNSSLGAGLATEYTIKAPFSAPAGAVVAINGFYSNASASSNALLWNDHRKRVTTGPDGKGMDLIHTAASGLSDLTSTCNASVFTGGSTGDNQSVGALPVFYFVGNTNKPTVAILGDSTDRGGQNITAWEPDFAMGWIAPSLIAGGLATINLSFGGMEVCANVSDPMNCTHGWVDKPLAREAVLPYVSDAIAPGGNNDIYLIAHSAATLAGDAVILNTHFHTVNPTLRIHMAGTGYRVNCIALGCTAESDETTADGTAKTHTADYVTIISGGLAESYQGPIAGAVPPYFDIAPAAFNLTTGVFKVAATAGVGTCTYDNSTHIVTISTGGPIAVPSPNNTAPLPTLFTSGLDPTVTVLGATVSVTGAFGVSTIRPIQKINDGTHILVDINSGAGTTVGTPAACAWGGETVDTTHGGYQLSWMIYNSGVINPKLFHWP